MKHAVYALYPDGSIRCRCGSTFEQPEEALQGASIDAFALHVAEAQSACQPCGGSGRDPATLNGDPEAEDYGQACSWCRGTGLSPGPQKLERVGSWVFPYGDGQGEFSYALQEHEEPVYRVKRQA